MALEIKITGTPKRYFESLDRPTQKRIKEKLDAVAKDPTNARLSYPLTSSQKRSTRVGTYRILFQVDDKELTVSDIGPRGQIYRNV